jgi:hypothetical protein
MSEHLAEAIGVAVARITENELNPLESHVDRAQAPSRELEREPIPYTFIYGSGPIFSSP